MSGRSPARLASALPCPPARIVPSAVIVAKVEHDESQTLAPRPRVVDVLAQDQLARAQRELVNDG
jgi:hypothetical protein